MIRKAVIPAAGFGTRFLPFTKAVPKEMIPVVDKPTIQYVVEEAVASGITDILMVVSAGKQAIQEHFSRNVELEQRLEASGKLDLLAEVRAISELANVHYVHQLELNGLGSAIHCAKSFVGDEPFAVLLGDTITTSTLKPVTRQLIDVYAAHGGSVVALEEVPKEKVSRYGVVDPGPTGTAGVPPASPNGPLVPSPATPSSPCPMPQAFRIHGIVEKPEPDQAPSNLVVASRYLFEPDIFQCIEKTPPGKNNEIQITDAMQRLLECRPLFGCRIDGRRHDIGNKEDFVKATIEFADPTFRERHFGDRSKV